MYPIPLDTISRHPQLSTFSSPSEILFAIADNRALGNVDLRNIDWRSSVSRDSRVARNETQLELAAIARRR